MTCLSIILKCYVFYAMYLLLTDSFLVIPHQLLMVMYLYEMFTVASI